MTNARWLEDTEDLLADAMSALRALRGYFMQMAEQHAGMDTGALDDLLRRYTEINLDDHV